MAKDGGAMNAPFCLRQWQQGGRGTSVDYPKTDRSEHHGSRQEKVPMVRLVDVGKRFGGEEALRGVEFTVCRGEVVGLLGHNGAGKTTTLKILATLLDPDDGRLDILDETIPSAHLPARYKARLGYLPDTPILYDYLTGREMLHFVGCLYGMRAQDLRQRIEALLERFELQDDADRWIRTYSKGMKRKVSLLASILHRPSFWYLDEPTESMDPIAISNLKQLILELRHTQGAVVLASHQLSLVEGIADRILVLHQGNLVFDGCLERFKELSGTAGAGLEDVYVHLFSGKMAGATDRMK